MLVASECFDFLLGDFTARVAHFYPSVTGDSGGHRDAN